MIKKITATFLVCIMAIYYLNACTTFVIKDSKNLVYGRNFDWDIASGFIVINKRGLAKQAGIQTPLKPAKWISKYGSITFNQIGIDSPMGGINEKGLTIAQMALMESQYPEKQDMATVNELEWIQFHLDNSSTIKEVIENNENIQVVPAAVPVHYLVCDRLGNMAVVEFINDQVIITQGKEITVPVCGNMIYEQSKTALRTYKRYGGQNPIPLKWNSLSDIIAIAGTMIEDYDPSENVVDYGFEILKTVGSETRTQWSVIFDINNLAIHFKTLNNKTVRKINFSDFNFSCEEDINIMNIHGNNNQTATKDQFKKLTYYEYFSYKRILWDAYASNLPGFPEIPDEAIEIEADYVFNQRKCTE